MRFSVARVVGFIALAAFGVLYWAIFHSSAHAQMNESVGMSKINIINDRTQMGSELGTVARRVMKAVRLRDWKTLSQDCDATIWLEHAHRAYPQFCPKSCRDHVFPDDLISTNGNDEVTFTGVIGCQISMRNPLSKSNSGRFRHFADLVNHTFVAPMNGAIEIGEDIQGSEIRSLSGPAIEGRIAGGSYWRIEFHRSGNQWRASQFIMEDH